MTTISLCMIVKDEEKVLSRCLESISPYVNEIIIVDTGSKDNTIEIAKTFNCRIFEYKWDDDFSSARNFSISQASGEYILILDADEYISMNTEIEWNLSESVYVINIQNITDGNIVNHQAIRLFKNSGEFKYKGRIHEHLDVTVNSSTPTFNEFLIHHTGYQRKIIQEKKKEKRNYELLLKEVKENPTGYNHFNLGTHYKSVHKYNKALESYKKAYPISTNYTFVTKLLLSMSECLVALNRNEEAIKILKDAIEVHPFYTDYYYELGNIYKSLECYKESEMYYNKALSQGEVKRANYISNEGVGSYLAYYKLGEVFLERLDFTKSLKYAVSSLQINKHYLPAITLFFRSVRSANPDETMQAFYTIWKPENEFEVHILVKTLYILRSTMLVQVLSNITKERIPDNIRLVSLLLEKKYYLASNGWREMEKIDEDNLADLFVTGLILKDVSLLELPIVRGFFNRDEMVIVRSLVEGLPLKKEIKLSSSLLKLINQAVIVLLSLREYEVFEEVMKNVYSSSTARYEIALSLIEFGFTEIAQDILKESSNDNRVSSKALYALFDLFMLHSRYDEAFEVLNTLAKGENDYKVYQRMQLLSEKYNNPLLHTQLSKLNPDFLTPITK